jgi:hypothetical protein
MKPAVVVVSRAEEVTSQQQQLEQQQQAERTPTSAAAPAPLRPVIISLTSQPQPPEAGAAVLLPRNKNVLKERFILKNCTTTAADTLSRLKVRIVCVTNKNHCCGS